MESSANSGQIEYWESSGLRWVAAQERIDAMIEPLGLRGIELARVALGERVIDVGCGCGATSLALAERVGPEGSVLGVDVSRPMLARAQERSAAAGHTQLRFVRADAQTCEFSESADVVFSRFGVMFFEDPVAAFGNLREALVPGGRLAFVCWQPLDQNAWMARPMEVVSRLVAPPPAPEAGAPGPFALADPVRVRGILEKAGFVSVEIQPERRPQCLGATPEAALAFLLDGAGPVSRALVDAGDDLREAMAAALAPLLAEHMTPEGVVFESAVWIVTAHRPQDG